MYKDYHKVSEVCENMIADEIIHIVSLVLKLEQNQVTLDSSIHNTLNWDSLNHLRILTAIEEKYGYTLKIEEISNVESVRDWIEVIKRYQQEGQPKC